jgi:FtsZ-binding cell division protein ZapB
MLEKWVETQRIISEEKRDLALAKEMLTERIDLVQREIETLRAKIEEAKKSIAEADKKRTELVRENEKLKEAAASLSSSLVHLEERAKQLLQRLPEALRDRVAPLSQSLPETPEETKLSLSERFQNVVGIVNEVNKFNGEISMRNEVRTLPDGTSAEVTALYLGIGQAYYTGANGTIAGVGTASDEGWVWRAANDAASRIAQTIAILKNEEVASFVQVPIEIK